MEVDQFVPVGKQDKDYEICLELTLTNGLKVKVRECMADVSAMIDIEPNEDDKKYIGSSSYTVEKSDSHREYICRSVTKGKAI